MVEKKKPASPARTRKPRTLKSEPAVAAEVVPEPVVAASVTVEPVPAPTREAIARRAHELYRARGGSAFDNWIQAERELGGR